MPASKKKLDYIATYSKANYKRYQLKVRKEEQEVINYLATKPSINGYIVDLIKADMALQKKDEKNH